MASQYADMSGFPNVQCNISCRSLSRSSPGIVILQIYLQTLLRMLMVMGNYAFAGPVLGARSCSGPI
jgi:hypothetical protein